MAYTETFPTVGEITSGQDQTWTEPSGDIDVSSIGGQNRAAATTENAYAYARCSTALASVNHRAFGILRYNGVTPSDNHLGMVAVGWASGAGSMQCYTFGLWNDGVGGKARLVKHDAAGSQTVLTSVVVTAPAQDTEYLCQLTRSVVGSQVFLTGEIDGVTVIDAFEDTSSPFTTGTLAGIVEFNNVAGVTSFRAFGAAETGLDHFTIEAADGSALRSQEAGTAFDVLLSARDAAGDLFTDFTGTVTVSATGATLNAGGGTTGSFVAGQKTVSLRIDALEEAVTIDVDDGSSHVGSSAEFAVWDLAATPVSPSRFDLTFSDHVAATGGQVHVSELEGFSPSDDPPVDADELATDWGYSLSGSATDPGKDELITFRHLAHMMSGYTRVDGAGEAWAYGDTQASLFAALVKKFLGGDATAADDSTEVAALALFAPLQLQDDQPNILASRNFMGLEVTPRDAARIGLLMENRGVWNGVKLLPASIFGTYGAAGTLLGEAAVPVDAALDGGEDANGDYLSLVLYGTGGDNQTTTGPGMFGWMWWVNYQNALTGVRPWPHLPGDAIMTDGAYGQNVLLIIPSLELVVAWQGDAGDSRSLGSDSTWNLNLKRIADAVTGVSPLTRAWPSADWADETPVNAELDESELDGLATAVGGRGIVIRSGYRVYTWGTQTGRTDWASCGKAILALVALKKISDYTLWQTFGNAVTSQQVEGLELGTEYFSRVVFTDGGGAIFETNEIAVTLDAGQVLHADAVLDAGGWTDTNGSSVEADLLASVLTTAAPDARSPVNPTSSQIAKFRIELAESASGILFKYGVRSTKLGRGQPGNLTVQLRSPDGSSLLAEWVHTDVGAVQEDFERDVSAITVAGQHQAWLIPSIG